MNKDVRRMRLPNEAREIVIQDMDTRIGEGNMRYFENLIVSNFIFYNFLYNIVEIFSLIYGYSKCSSAIHVSFNMMVIASEVVFFF